eukprot:NODE_1085_length_1107_cov_74.620983_g834_i0.p1 GENE.NODE_1085_length_1107_cov_74.620983_g834_i0~~NODE_1085_length_1107_cov_74.620983_g834_i0.p1  ORF type:complete len:351 (+),score=96.26 NODE_1085_length_1107_cov_74.620983_g834_i0:78-1055(+)
MAWRLWVAILVLCVAMVVRHCQSLAPDYVSVNSDTPTEGRYAPSAYGRTWYVLHNEAACQHAPLTILVHGFSLSSSVAYARLAPYLASQGHCVLTYDLYGRGFSDSPPASVPHAEQLYVAQLASLLFSVRPSAQPVNLLGSSMGGAIVAAFAATYPKLIRHLVLVAPAGLPVPVPLAAKFATLPGVGETIMPLLMMHNFKAMYARSTAPGDKEGAAKAHASLTHVERVHKHHPGFLHAILSTLRYFPMGALKETFAQIGKGTDYDILIVWGDKDVVVPFANAAALHTLIPSARLLVVQGAGHDPLHEGEEGDKLQVLHSFLAHNP